MEDLLEGVLKKKYYDPSDPGSFGGINRLLRSAKDHGFSKEEVEEFLKNQNTYTLHKDRRFKFSRNRVITLHKDYQWMADLADMQSYASQNDGFRYILVVIDTFTKYAWARAIKTKRPEDVRDAFHSIFEEKRIPLHLQTDRGKEFENKMLKEFYKKHDIIYFTSQNSTFKCSIVERMNRTLKSRMFRYFTSVGKHRFIDVLPKLMESYNNSFHRSIKMSPKEASSTSTSSVFKNLYGVNTLTELLESLKKKPKHHVGNIARIAYDRGVFDKGYLKTHADATGTIAAITKQPIPMYQLKDYAGDTLKRKFYEKELQVIPEPKYRIEKVIKSRTIDGKTEYFVKWLGYPSSANSWVDSVEDV